MGKVGQNHGAAGTPDAADPFSAWVRTIPEYESYFSVSATVGFFSSNVLLRREICGPNKLEKHSGPSIWYLVLDQFSTTIIHILLTIVVISFVLAWYDGDEGGEMGITAFFELLIG